MEPTRSTCACLCVGLVLLFNTRVHCQSNSSSTTMIYEPQQISNSSRYYDQVEFINDFLLNNAGNITTYPFDFTMPPTNNIQESNETTLQSTNNLDTYTTEDNVETNSSRDNNTMTNELQVIPVNSVPAAFSSVIDTLPVHPRIPRRSVAKRRTRVRLNRHSTRVNPALPVRFLLPPPIAKHECSGHSEKANPPFKIKPIIIISSSTPLIPISAVATPNEYVVTAKPLQVKSEQEELSPINVSPNRRVFVPPPPRHLLPPPYSHDNHLNNHYTSTTTQNSSPELNSDRLSSPQSNVYESSTKPHECEKSNRIESSTVTPIVVVEDIREINHWSSTSSSLPPAHSSSYIEQPVRNVELIHNNEPIRNVESFNNFPPANYNNRFMESTTSEKSPLQGMLEIPLQHNNNDYETQLCDKNHSRPNNQLLYSENLSSNNPQQFNLNNQPLPANNQLFFPNRQGGSQNNKIQFFPNIPQKYYTQQPFSNNQLQSSTTNHIFPNNKLHFNQDYQQSLSADNQQTHSTSSPQDFKLNNAPFVNNLGLDQNKPHCNETKQEQFATDNKQHGQHQFPSDNHYGPQPFPSDKKNNQLQLNSNHQYNQHQIPLDKQHNQQQFPSDEQHNQQQFLSDKQYGQQQLSPTNEYNQQQIPSGSQYNHQQFTSHNEYNQQQLHPTHPQLHSDKQHKHQRLNPESQQQYTSNNPYYQQEVNQNDQQNFSPSGPIQFPQTSATQTSVTREPSPFGTFKSSQFEHYPLKPTTPLPLSSSVQPYPILRGPNIEQALFDTGNFQVDGNYFNNTDDSTVAMMNRPLLTQEVARMGMKITASLKMEQIKKAKLSRGKYKYNHLNQFNFPDLDEPTRFNEVSKSSKLSVAETSYYKDRRGVQELTETADLSVIPGTPGVDYPILNRPPLKSDFSCRSVKNHRGYVADPSTRCQVFYICVGSGPGEAMLCPNGTLFSQDFLVCDWWFNIDCQPIS